METRIFAARFISPPAHSRSQNGVAALAYAQRAVGRGAGGPWPPCFLNLRRCEASAMGGGTYDPPPRLTLLRNVRRPSPPLRGEGESRFSFSRRISAPELCHATVTSARNGEQSGTGG